MIDDAYIVGVDNAASRALQRDYDNVARVVSLVARDAAATGCQGNLDNSPPPPPQTAALSPSIEHPILSDQSSSFVSDTQPPPLLLAGSQPPHFSPCLPDSPACVGDPLRCTPRPGDIVCPPTRFRAVVQDHHSSVQFIDLQQICYIDEGTCIILLLLFNPIYI